MGSQRPPYVKVYKDRHGKARIYFRRRGYPSKPLPGPLYSPEFWQAYQACMSAPKREVGARFTKPGTMNEVIVSYYRSAEFLSLKESTKTTYRGIIERFRKEHGDKRVAKLQRKHVRKMIQARSDTPAAANNLLRIIHLLMRHAMDLDMRPDDPTVGIRKFSIRSEGHRTWEESAIDDYVKKHPPGTRAHLALILLLYTGLRRSDVVRVGPQHIRDGYLTIRQTKTGTEVSIPVHPRLREALDQAKPDSMVYLTTAYGKPFTANGFGNWFRDKVQAAGLANLSAHGLRKSISRRLAEAGCTPHEIMAITGHRNLKEVELYTAAANRRRMAQSAMGRLGE